MFDFVDPIRALNPPAIIFRSLGQVHRSNLGFELWRSDLFNCFENNVLKT